MSHPKDLITGLFQKLTLRCSHGPGGRVSEACALLSIKALVFGWWRALGQGRLWGGSWFLIGGGGTQGTSNSGFLPIGMEAFQCFNRDGCARVYLLNGNLRRTTSQHQCSVLVW